MSYPLMHGKKPTPCVFRLQTEYDKIRQEAAQVIMEEKSLRNELESEEEEISKQRKVHIYTESLFTNCLQTSHSVFCVTELQLILF